MDSEDREVAGTTLMEATESGSSHFGSDQPYLSGVVANTTAEQYPRSLHSINAEFFHHVNSYKQHGGQNVFSVALIEYLRVLKSCRDSNSSHHESLHQKVCDAENPEKLKSIITTDMWEKVRLYVDALEADLPTTPPAMFNKSDLPTAKANYGLVQPLGNGSMRVDQVTLGDMNIQDVTQALGLAIQNQVARAEEPASSYKWHTFHVTQLPETMDAVNFGAFARAAVSKVRGTESMSGVKSDFVPSTSKNTRSQITPEDHSKFLDGEPTDIDVKFGRGGGTNNHKGNVMYLLEKLRLQPAYTLLATGRGKTCISIQLVAAVHSWGGRFVAKDDKTERWFEVDSSTARRKASQTLREDKTPAEQEQKRLLLTRKLEELERDSRKRRKTKHTAGDTLLVGETLLQLNGDQLAGESNL